MTSISRTVADLARTLPDRAFERLVDEALKRIGAARLAKASPRARDLLDEARPSSLTWSAAEERLRELIRRAGLPAPESNVPVGPYVPDLLWREERVIVEYDSIDYHRGPGAFHRDSPRSNDLESWGYRVIHVTGRQLRDHPEQVLVWIAVALARAQTG